MQVCEEDARDLLTALGWEGVDGWSPPKLVAKMNVLPVVAEGDRVATLEGSERDLYDRVIAARQRGEDVVLDSEDEEESEDCDAARDDEENDADEDEEEDDGEEEDGVPAATRNGRHPRLKVKRVDPPSRRTVKIPKGKETAKEKAQRASEPKKVRKAAPARVKTPKYAAKGKSPKVKKKGEDGRGPGIIAFIKTCLQKASEKRPITRERLVDRLAKKFPDRDAEAMGRTVRTQVPTQLRYKGFEVYANESGGFWADPVEETEE